jgi:hypothetical protein
MLLLLLAAGSDNVGVGCIITSSGTSKKTNIYVVSLKIIKKKQEKKMVFSVPFAKRE